MNTVEIRSLFDLSQTIACGLLEQFTYPWEVLPHIKSYILKLGASLSSDEYFHPEEDIWISKTAKVASSAKLCGPLIIGPDTEIRHCAFIRGSAIIGASCVIGNSCELKNAIIFNNAQIPHFNYVGDSIIGYRSHMGAGSITSNVKSDKTLVSVRVGGKILPTGMKKFGAMLGDFTEVGCNSVLNPGTITGRHVNIYPLSCVRGYVPENTIYKDRENIVEKEER